MGWKDFWFNLKQQQEVPKGVAKRINNIRAYDLEILQDLAKEHESRISLTVAAQEGVGSTILSYAAVLSADKDEESFLEYIAFMYNRLRVKRSAYAQGLVHILDQEVAHPFEENQPEGDFLKNWRPIDLKALINQAPPTQVQLGPIVQLRGAIVPLQWRDPDYLHHKFSL